MNRRLTSADFEEGDDFELFRNADRDQLEGRFAELKTRLLDTVISETETLPLFDRFEFAANEAAALAWNTEFPLLVFPELFEEFARRERIKEGRQQRIRAKSENLMQCTV